MGLKFVMVIEDKDHFNVDLPIMLDGCVFDIARHAAYALHHNHNYTVTTAHCFDIKITQIDENHHIFPALSWK